MHKSNILPYNLIISFSIKDAMEQKKSAQKRQQLLNAALDVFSVYGFNGASLDEIAQLADMHKSNIFYYYENKEALYVEVLTTVMQKWLAPLQSLESELEPTEALSHYIMTKIEISRTQPKASKLFALEVIQGAPHILPILKGPLKKLFKRKAKVILNWQAQGKISDQIDAELLIINIWALTQNYADFSTQIEMVTGKTLRNKSMCQRAIEHTIHMTLYGVLPRN
ncbi:TetR/AcrR family transcriptional regulator [Acinetobacter sp. BIGb0196]|nr:TetR/AcrR family transcriptional regulator [Acinetobacter guillouiae]MCW2253439.1 TetR/AcrR family transcriptional regulator [Acinetobacter sp. BIGb0204]NII37767.1 TetR/AcrR family transcriptional regulator [Acinetobacter sp. BIGb0196]